MNTIEPLLWIIVLAPLCGAAVLGLLSAISPKRGEFPPRLLVNAVACLGPMIALIISLGVFINLSHTSQNIVHQNLFTWISCGNLSISFGLEADRLTAMMLLIITFVGTIIHIYSIGYMSHDTGYARYFSYLNLFLSSMLILVMGSNIVVMFMGWEGVGACSYLLIGFWFNDEAKAAAGKKAFITNRIGDFGFVLGIFLIYKVLSPTGMVDLEFSTLAKNAGLLAPMATIIGLLLFMGAAGKSAQIPLYVWLPDAMAGPTPVSALIHAATMVTAGVFMVARMHFLYELTPFAGQVIAGVGIATALLAGAIGIGQNDIKKVLAYSTVSQLGYMFVGVGVGAYSSGMFHVFTHAFFKACLFLGAGSVIHALSGEQDLRKMGGLLKRLPITGWTFLIGFLAICGIPPLAGFFSKDEILWNAFNVWGSYGKALWLAGLIGAGMTAFYMSRLVFLCFFGENRTPEPAQSKIHESPLSMTIPLIVLAVGSALVGFLGMPQSLGGGNMFSTWLEPVFGVKAEHDAPVSIEYILMALSIAVVCTGILLAYFRYVKRPVDTTDPVGIGRILARALYVDELYAFVLLNPLTLISRSVLHGIIDVKIIDGSINGLAWVTAKLGGFTRRLQSGSVRTALYYMGVGFAVIMVIIFTGKM